MGLIVFYVFLFCRKFGVALFYFLPHLSLEVNLPEGNERNDAQVS